MITPFSAVEVRPDEGVWVLRLGVKGMTVAEEEVGLTGGASKVRLRFADMRGSTLATEVQGAGVLSSTVDYDAWGQSNGGDKPPAHRFVDEEPDAFGSLSLGRRVYAPSLRRWLAPDPLILTSPSVDEDDGRQLDLYGYAANNPVKHTDGTGTVVETAFDIASFAAGLYSISQWDSSTSTASKVADVLGVLVDGAAVALPVVPGGIGLALKSARAAENATDAAGAANKVEEAGVAVFNKYEGRAGDRHATVVIKDADGKMLGEFHQTGTGDVTTIEPTEMGKTWKKTASSDPYPLADPKAAADFGKSGQKPGPYRKKSNDCVTGACAVANQGKPLQGKIPAKQVRKDLDME